MLNLRRGRATDGSRQGSGGSASLLETTSPWLLRWVSLLVGGLLYVLLASGSLRPLIPLRRIEVLGGSGGGEAGGRWTIEPAREVQVGASSTWEEPKEETSSPAPSSSSTRQAGGLGVNVTGVGRAVHVCPSRQTGPEASVRLARALFPEMTIITKVDTSVPSPERDLLLTNGRCRVKVCTRPQAKPLMPLQGLSSFATQADPCQAALQKEAPVSLDFVHIRKTLGSILAVHSRTVCQHSPALSLGDWSFLLCLFLAGPSMQDWPGTILYWDPERGRIEIAPHPRTFYMGPKHPHQIPEERQASFAGMIEHFHVATTVLLDKHYAANDLLKRPVRQQGSPPRFLVYAHSNCVQEREAAFDALEEQARCAAR